MIFYELMLVIILHNYYRCDIEANPLQLVNDCLKSKCQINNHWSKCINPAVTALQFATTHFFTESSICSELEMI